MSVRVMIADDHSLLRAGLRAVLRTAPNLDVIGEASDGAEVLDLAPILRPDVVLMDISMPELNGVETTRRLRDLMPDTRVLILTVHEDQGLLQEAVRAGASGYIVKRAAESELVAAIEAVAGGDLYVHPTMLRDLLPKLVEHEAPEPTSEDAPALTPRETQVLRLIARGHTNRQIAERLVLSVRTVESHRANLMTKLHLHSRVELVRYASEHGLLDMDGF